MSVIKSLFLSIGIYFLYAYIVCSENMIKINIIGNEISAPRGYCLTSINKNYSSINLDFIKTISVTNKDLDETNQTISFELFYKDMFFQKSMIAIEIEKLNNAERKQQFIDFHKLNITKFNKDKQCIFKRDKYANFYTNTIYKQENNIMIIITIGPNQDDLVKHFSLSLGCQTPSTLS